MKRREKSATLGLVLCFVAMIAVAGAVSFGQSKQRDKLEQQKLAEAETDADETNDTEEKTEEAEESQSANTDSIQAELDVPGAMGEPVLEEPIVPQVPSLYFSATSELLWPVDGNVLLSYSMDETVYFSTLDQYKYNPAIIIGGEVGADVLAAAEGEVISIVNTPQTGTTITMSLGNTYELVYGQLQDVCVQEGERVSKGQVIGCVSEPTKYYSVEGPNVYFQLLKDGESVNPLEYLAE